MSGQQPQADIVVIGGGLAGCEAAWAAARRGCSVRLCEMKPLQFSPAHTSGGLAELVCSNSLRSDSPENAAGLLKAELRACGSLIMEAAAHTAVPAGAALAVDREEFSALVTARIEADPAIHLERTEVTHLPADAVAIVASGPLTSRALSSHLQQLVGGDLLYFHDAISPIVETDSIDPRKTFSASRYGKGTDDYLNCPMTRAEYDRFYEALCAAETAPLRPFETLVPFEGCMPIEIMAARGRETLVFGPMKPVGLVDPRTGARPHAVVQLRRENLTGTLHNLVGFQTRLKWPEQQRVFRMIPGLEQAVFARFGSLHRNTYINSPRLLRETLQLRSDPGVFFAGQITGVEGYVESTAMGLVAGLQAAARVRGQDLPVPPPTTIMGALLSYVTRGGTGAFQPMNANFGILPPLEKKTRRSERKQLYARRAMADIQQWAGQVMAAPAGG